MLTKKDLNKDMFIKIYSKEIWDKVYDALIKLGLKPYNGRNLKDKYNSSKSNQFYLPEYDNKCTVIHPRHGTYNGTEFFVSDIIEEPKDNQDFIYKVGDKLKVIQLRSWSSDGDSKYPIGKIENKIVTVVNIEMSRDRRCGRFDATCEGVKYGFAIASENVYEIIKEEEDMDSILKDTSEVKSELIYPEYYECTVGSGEEFTKGKIYKIINPENLEDNSNFIDNDGDENGWSGNNHEHFKPSTKAAFDKQEEITNQKEMKYAIGKIQFKGKVGGDTIPTYIYSDIPHQLIKHGRTRLNKKYNDNKADIVAHYNGFYIVKFLDDRGNFVQLAFKEDVLEPVSKSYKYDIGDTVWFDNLNYKLDFDLYCSTSNGRNHEVFIKFKIDKRELSNKVLGYYKDGLFPYTRSLGDLNKYIEAIKAEIVKFKKGESGESLKSIPTPEPIKTVDNWGVFRPVKVNGLTFNHGDSIKCTIEGIVIEDAKIGLDGFEPIYICQNFKAGADANDKLGYKYSWALDPAVEDIQLGSTTKSSKSSISVDEEIKPIVFDVPSI